MTSSSLSRDSQVSFLASVWRLLSDRGAGQAGAEPSTLRQPFLEGDGDQRAHGGEGRCRDCPDSDGGAEPILATSFPAIAPGSDLGAQSVNEGFADPCADSAALMGASHTGSGAGAPQGVRGASPSGRGAAGEASDWRPSKAPLGRFTVLGYGTGHMLNDLTSACWFTYLLIFLTDIGLSPQQAAWVMMAGQLADAFATLIAGRLIDRFGHFKLWHLGGSLCTALSFSSVFGGCLVCSLTNSSSAGLQAVSYSVFAAVFNMGWAATQVSHMSMVNCMTCNPSSRVALNSCRNAFTMGANLTLYGVAFLAFWLLPAGTPILVQRQFRWIAGGAVGIGLVFVLIFQSSISEPRPKRDMRRSISTARRAWAYWFRQMEYYQVAAVYALTRLICNVSQAILPFFIVRDLNMHQSAKAVVPAMVFVFSFLVSIVLQELHWSARRLKLCYGLGSALWLLTSALCFGIEYQQQWLLYALAAVMGAACALILVAATSMEGVLVGHRIDGCAFVYGSLSFLDKVTSGVCLFAIEAFNDPSPFCGVVSDACPRSLVRWVLVLLPLTCACVSTLIVWATKLEDHEGVSVAPLEDVDVHVVNGVDHLRSLTESLLQTSFEPGAAGSRILSEDRPNLKS